MSGDPHAEPPVIVVAGLGRCGSSLMMQMLAAAGIRCAGNAPGYEAPEVMAPTVPEAWLHHHRGGAVKVLDPHRHRLPPSVPAFVIWMSRDRREQARSAVKFASMMATGQHTTNRKMVRGMEAVLHRDTLAAHAVLRAIDVHLAFETILDAPLAVALFLEARLSKVIALRSDAAHRMARAVRPRGPECLPGLMEIDLMMEARNAG